MSAFEAGPLLVMGTGCVGGWIGGRLAAGGAEVHFVTRPRMRQALQAGGMTVTDLEGGRDHLGPERLNLHESVPAGLSPGLVLLTVKSGSTAEAAAELGAMLPAGTLVLSLQNGVGQVGQAQAAAPSLQVLAGMVPYNIAELAPGHLHRGTAGRLVAQAHPALQPWVQVFERTRVPLQLVDSMEPVQWGKLLINLNNPVNALSGLPLREQLMDADLRRCTAALMAEALQVLQATGMQPARIAALPPQRLIQVLRLPTLMFKVLAARMLRIDDKARSSMADDLQQGRTTEVDALCGAVVARAKAHGLDAPMNARMVGLVANWPHSPRRWSGRELMGELVNARDEWK